MSRFLRSMKTDRRPGGRDDEDGARDVGRAIKAGSNSKKAQKNKELVSGHHTALPTLEPVDFRTSLILPGLSKRFSVLKPSLSGDLSETDLRQRLASQRTRMTEGPSLTIEEEDLIVAELRSRRQPADYWDSEPPLGSTYFEACSSTSPNPANQSTSSPPLQSHYSDYTLSPLQSSTSTGSLNTFGGAASPSMLERDRGVTRAYGLTTTSGMRDAEYIRRTRKQSEAVRTVSASNSVTSLAGSELEEGPSQSHTPKQEYSPERPVANAPRVSSRPGSRTHSPSASLSLSSTLLPSQSSPFASPLPTPQTASQSLQTTIPRSPRRRSLLAGLTPAQVRRISAALEEIEEDIGVRHDSGDRRKGSAGAIEEEEEREDLNDEDENDASESNGYNDRSASPRSQNSAPFPFSAASPASSSFSQHLAAIQSSDYAQERVPSPRPASPVVSSGSPSTPSPFKRDVGVKGYIPGMVRPIGSSADDGVENRSRAGSMGSQHYPMNSRARSGSTPIPPSRVPSHVRSQSTSQTSQSASSSRGITSTPPVTIAQLRNGVPAPGMPSRMYSGPLTGRRPSSPSIPHEENAIFNYQQPAAAHRDSVSSIGAVPREYATQSVSSQTVHDGKYSVPSTPRSERGMPHAIASPTPTVRGRDSAASIGSSFLSDTGAAVVGWDDVLREDESVRNLVVDEIQTASVILTDLSGLSKDDLLEMQLRLVKNAKDIRDALRGPEIIGLGQPSLVPRPSFRARHVSTNPEDEDEFRRAISPQPMSSPSFTPRHQHTHSQTSIQRMLRGRAAPVPVNEGGDRAHNGDSDQAALQPTPEISETSHQLPSEPSTPRQDSPFARQERTQALAQVLFGDDGNLQSPELDVRGFATSPVIPEPRRNPVSVRDDPAVIRDFEERIAKATARLQRTPSTAAKPLSRKGTKRGQTPKVISSPQLVSSTVNVPTTPLSPPGTATDSRREIDPTIARALEKASGTKMSARIKRFAGFKKTLTLESTDPPASAVELSSSKPQGRLAAPINLQAGGGASAPAVMENFIFPSSTGSPASSPKLVEGIEATSVPSPPLSTNPQGFKGVMTRFKRGRKKSDTQFSRPESPGYGLVEPEELKALVKLVPGHQPKPESETLQLQIPGRPSENRSKSPNALDRAPASSMTDDAALAQLYNAADTLGLDTSKLDQLVSPSNTSASAHSENVTTSTEQAAGSIIRTAGGDGLSVTVAPPLPVSILRSSSRTGDKPNVVVRRTLIIPQDAAVLQMPRSSVEAQSHPAVVADGSHRKLSIKRKPVKLNIADRELVSASTNIDSRGGSIPSADPGAECDTMNTASRRASGSPSQVSDRQDLGASDLLSPSLPTCGAQIPISPSNQSFAASQRRSSAGGGSLYDLYADYHDEDDTSAPLSASSEELPSLTAVNRLENPITSQHAVEICELSDGQMVWSVVEGLQGFEDAQRDSVYSAEENADESDYAYSRPISALASRNAARSEPLQLYIKGQDRSENGLQQGDRRKAAATGSERPETKVYYSSSSNVVDLIDSLSRNLDQGRFDIIPTSGLGAPPSEEEESHVYHARQGSHVGEVRHLGTPLGLPTSSSDGQGKSRTVEERLQALLDRVQALPA